MFFSEFIHLHLHSDLFELHLSSVFGRHLKLSRSLEAKSLPTSPEPHATISLRRRSKALLSDVNLATPVLLILVFLLELNHYRDTLSGL